MSTNYNFLKRNRNHKTILRIISFLLVSSFLYEQISFANPDIKPIDWNPSGKLKVGFKLPESVAVIEDSWKSEDGGQTADGRWQTVDGREQKTEIKDKLVYLIQDAHTNNSGQLNVAKTLDIIFQSESIQYVFLEAGFGNESLSFLRKYADLKKENKSPSPF